MEDEGKKSTFESFLCAAHSFVRGRNGREDLIRLKPPLLPIQLFPLFYRYHRNRPPLFTMASLHRITPTTRLLAQTFAKSTPLGVASTASPAAGFALRQFQQSVRGAATATTARPPTAKLTPQDSMNVLNEQRSVRPISPHLTIYAPQLTSMMSIGNRG